MVLVVVCSQAKGCAFLVSLATHPPATTCVVRGSARGRPPPGVHKPWAQRWPGDTPDSTRDPQGHGSLELRRWREPPTASRAASSGSHSKPGCPGASTDRVAPVRGEEVAVPARTLGTASGGSGGAPHPCPRQLRPAQDPLPGRGFPGARPPGARSRGGPTRPGHSPGRAPAAGPGSGVPRAAARRPGSGHSLPRTPSNAGAATSPSAAAARHVTPPGPPPAPRPAPPPAPRRAQRRPLL
ncbi:proline-rich protein HaeIII subfamily 1-like [Ovis canadensis]|uniref:proline-rich protein HaeIII subfamily 1-like n=1 Tax=Ovis canadensis TaxID=37174 RepID=UPI0037516F71